MDIKVVLDLISTLCVVAGVVFTVYKINLINKDIKVNHEWKIRETSLKYSGLYHPEIRESKLFLNKVFNFSSRNDTIPMEEVQRAIAEDKKTITHLNNILTYYENISLACQKQIVSEDIIFDMFGKGMVNTRHRLANYIRHNRQSSNNERLWKEFVNYAAKFEAKLQQPSEKLERLA